jgi:hypothetical protein
MSARKKSDEECVCISPMSGEHCKSQEPGAISKLDFKAEIRRVSEKPDNTDRFQI